MDEKLLRNGCGLTDTTERQWLAAVGGCPRLNDIGITIECSLLAKSCRSVSAWATPVLSRIEGPESTREQVLDIRPLRKSDKLTSQNGPAPRVHSVTSYLLTSSRPIS